jgi:hypothetical protein
MRMALVKLKFQPGVNREGTDYENSGGWFSSDKVRFRMGVPEKIGGWVARTTTAFVGTCRALLPWTALDGEEYIGIGTSIKLYVDVGTLPTDITPIRESSTINTNPFAITSGSATVTVTDSGHGASPGDYVTYSGTASTGDATLTAAVLNAEYVIDSVTDASTYVFTASASSASTTSSVGGASVVAAYQINIGLNSAVAGTGWGTGTFGRLTWGSAFSSATDITAQLRLWYLASFGEDLVANVYNGSIYKWDASSGTGTRAVALTSLVGASGTPTICRKILVAAESRHLLALGCDPADAIGTQDTMLIRWPDAETLTDWTEDTTNTAGSLRLNVGSEIVTGLITKRDTLVWTDTSLNSVSYTGAPFFFGTKVLATNISIMGPSAAIEANDVVFWMGQDNFWYYDGSAKTLPCTLRDHVFKNLNRDQALKIHVGINRGDSEIIWFYPTTTEEIDSYVVFNYGQRIWYGGTMVRTAWMDRSFTNHPVAAYTDGKLYHHELGWDDGTTDPVSGIAAYAESSNFEMIPGDGYQFAFIRRLIPDVSFTGSSATSPAVTITLTPKDFPGEATKTADTGTVTRTASTPVEEYTKQAHIRVRGRMAAYKIESSATGVAWRDGHPRLEVRPDGRR